MKYNFKTVSIIGIARSGVAVALFLKNRGYDVFISDNKFFDTDNTYINILQENEIEFELGYHSFDKISQSDLVVVSPGVPLNIDLLIKLKKINKTIIGEIELAYSFIPKKTKIIGITGTNGKSTTTSLIGEIFRNAGYKTIVAGNIGKPFINYIDDIDNNTVVVLELSSFQLETINYFKPYISIILNITPDHMDRYYSMDDYVKAKFNIIKNQDNYSYLIINNNINFDYNKELNIVKIQDNNKIDKYTNMLDSKMLLCNYNGKEEKILFDNLFLLGKHNYENIASAAAAALIYGIDKNIIKSTVENFKSLNHRLEYVKEIYGVKYYNDSKATNPESAEKAILSFNNNIILIMGGRAKGSGFHILKKSVKDRVKLFIMIGEAKDMIIEELNIKKNYIKSDNLSEAIIMAQKNSVSGDIVLFSPACTSFDMFIDYEDRGNKFKKIVNSL